jgi:hypothetical protein
MRRRRSGEQRTEDRRENSRGHKRWSGGGVGGPGAGHEEEKYGEHIEVAERGGGSGGVEKEASEDGGDPF